MTRNVKNVLSSIVVLFLLFALLMTNTLTYVSASAESDSDISVEKDANSENAANLIQYNQWLNQQRNNSIKIEQGEKISNTESDSSGIDVKNDVIVENRKAEESTVLENNTSLRFDESMWKGTPKSFSLDSATRVGPSNSSSKLRAARAVQWNLASIGINRINTYHYAVTDLSGFAHANVATSGDLVYVMGQAPNKTDKLTYGYIKTRDITAAEAQAGAVLTMSGGATILYANAVSDGYGNRYNLKIDISGVQIKPKSNATAKIQSPIICQFNSPSGLGFEAYSPWHEYKSTNGGFVPDTSKKKKFGARFAVTVSVWNLDGTLAPAGYLGIGFRDLDTTGLNEDDYANVDGYGSFKESIRFYAPYAIDQLVWLESDNCLTYMTSADGSFIDFSGTRPTGDPGQPDKLKSGISWRCPSTGSIFYWAGSRDCLTSLNLLFEFRVPTLYRYTYVFHQQANGTWDAGTLVDSGYWLQGLWLPYSYTWVRNPVTEPVSVYGDASPASISDNLYAYTTNVQWNIYVPRHQYTYSFDANLPSGKTTSDLSGMPGAFTRFAENLSDASVASPSLRGYKFKGWSTSADGTGSAYPGAESMLSNKVFYAQWERSPYIVHYDANSSQQGIHMDGEFTQNVVTGTMEDSVFDFDTTYNLRKNAYEREGYEFTGWNTKPMGNGVSYADEASVENLVGYDKSEITLYAQWKKQRGVYSIHVMSEETGDPVPGVSMTLYKKVDGTWTKVPNVGTKTTDEHGQIEVENLFWFDYQWRCTDVPAGYKLLRNIDFRIDYNHLSLGDYEVLYMKHVQIVLDSSVSEVIAGEAAPAFMYEIRGNDAAGVMHKYELMVQTSLSSKFGTNRVVDLFAGEYTVRQMPVSRYRAGNPENVSNAVIYGSSAFVDVLNNTSAEVLFPYTLSQYQGFSHTDGVKNALEK